MKILAAPCSMSFTESGHATGYNLTYNIAKIPDVNFISLAKNVSIKNHAPANVKLIRVGPEVENLAGALLWPYAYYKNAKYWLAKEKIDLIHHMRYFTFSPDGFNSLALMGLTKDYPFVIGPAQTPHIFLEEDYTLSKGSTANLEFKVFSSVRSLASPILKALFKKTLEKCDTLIAVNQDTKDFFSAFMKPSKIVVIPLGLEKNDFEFTVPPNNHEILALGTHIKRKGFEYLIEAMVRVVKEFPDAHLSILSDGPRRKHLETLIERLGLKRSVFLPGFVTKDQMAAYFKNSRVFCHPSLSEGFCHSILEAMACGKPVVCTKTFGSQMVKNGENGFVVEPANSDQLAEYLLKVLGDYELSLKFGKAGRKTVENEYDWKVVSRQYYDVYRKLMM
jgi:glycosyltransferase involved in cell wall biosynthesis